jgi:fluoroquinolone transport system permease protein
MKRLLNTLRCDMRLQYRNGFYYAAALVAVIAAILLSQIRQSELQLLLPAFVFTNILINTFYFISGLVLLEKGEGTLESLIVTPLRHGEYLWSKILTLVTLSEIETFAIVFVVYGLNFSWLWLAAGTGLLGALYALLGFIFVARYDTINEFLFPSFLITLLLSIPQLGYFQLLQSPFFYLHPLQAPLILLEAAFRSVSAWQLVYGITYSLLWIGISFTAAQRAFYRFVILKQGIRT